MDIFYREHKMKHRERDFRRKGQRAVDRRCRRCGKDSVLQAREDYPHLDLIQSECQCGDGNNTWEYVMYTYHLIRHYFRVGVRANVYWNMALDNGGLSTWGRRQNSLISIDGGEYSFNPEFYVLKHFAHFVKKGAVMLSTVGEMSSNAAVFKNKDGSVVMNILNPYEFKKAVTVGDKNYRLKPRAFNTVML